MNASTINTRSPNIGDGLAPPPLPTAVSTSSINSKSSIPISRTTGHQYEKPERARTSHACEPCRERKTKCDGERPSCRRCLHTGTSCHYGYGKGWRKRKTAEDLTATSRRLARYEALLNEITPMVSPNVREMIEQAREQDAANSTSSEATETDTPRSHPSLTTELSTSSTNSRLPLQLPVPSALATQASRTTPTVPPFDTSFTAVSISTINVRPTSQNSLSPGGETASGATRLPSITPNGLLIEPSASAGLASPKTHSSDTGSYVRDSTGSGQVNTPSGPSSYELWSQESNSGRVIADSRKRDHETAFSSWLMRPNAPPTPPEVAPTTASKTHNIVRL